MTNPTQTWVKICGLRRAEDIRVAIDAGADLIGFILYPKSPRYVAPEEIQARLAEARVEFGPERARAVGVFVDEPAERVANIARRLELFAVQLHGAEGPDVVRSLTSAGIRVIKGVRVKGPESLVGLEAVARDAYALLLDAYDPRAMGGTGKRFALDLARPWVANHRVLIAGGLDPDNVAEVARDTRPFGVDVSSGVEDAPAVKNAARVRAFVQAVRDVDVCSSDFSLPPMERPC